MQNKMNIVPSNEHGEDFEMTHQFAWIKVGNYSVQIVDDADELRLRVYPFGEELEEIDALYVAK